MWSNLQVIKHYHIYTSAVFKNYSDLIVVDLQLKGSNWGSFFMTRLVLVLQFSLKRSKSIATSSTGMLVSLVSLQFVKSWDESAPVEHESIKAAKIGVGEKSRKRIITEDHLRQKFPHPCSFHFSPSSSFSSFLLINSFYSNFYWLESELDDAQNSTFFCLDWSIFRLLFFFSIEKCFSWRKKYSV